MRTKALLGLAVLAVSAATCVAQNVYSLNIVGYVNLPVTADKFYLIENPLTQASGNGNAISNIIKLDNTFNNSLLFAYNNGKLEAVETYFTDFGWYPGTTVLNPGQGFYLLPKAAGTVTFVGEVVLTNSTTLATGFNMVASAYPAAMSMQALGLTGQENDLVFRFNTAAGKLYEPVTFFKDYGWYDSNVTDGGPPAGPTLNVGEAIWYVNKGAAPIQWTQSFTVGQ